MNNQASRVAVVNQIARQLMHNGHPSEKDIKSQQDKLNNRYKQMFCFVFATKPICRQCKHHEAVGVIVPLGCDDPLFYL